MAEMVLAVGVGRFNLPTSPRGSLPLMVMERPQLPTSLTKDNTPPDHTPSYVPSYGSALVQTASSCHRDRLSEGSSLCSARPKKCYYFEREKERNDYWETNNFVSRGKESRT